MYWGTGQPSAVSLDKKGKVLLTYTEGYKQTTIKFEELDMSDMDSFSRGEIHNIVTQGLVQINGMSDIANNADIAVCPEKDTIIMVRDVHPTPATYPDSNDSETTHTCPDLGSAADRGGVVYRRRGSGLRGLSHDREQPHQNS